MKKAILVLIFCTHLSKLSASSFFLPDSDTMALVTLVTNTAATVSNTLKILKVAKQSSEQIEKYNNLAERRLFIARRIEQHARDIKEAGRIRPKNLSQINYAINRLKRNLGGLKSNIDSMGAGVYQVQNLSDRYGEKLNNSIIDETESHNQEINSAKAGTVGSHVQNTAMNTALHNKISSKIRKDHLEYQRIDLEIKKNRALETLRREQHYRSWIGVDYKNKGRYESLN